MEGNPTNHQREISAREKFQVDRVPTARSLSSRTGTENEQRKTTTKASCMHDSKEIIALEGEIAFETFINCLKKHIIPEILTEYNKTKERVMATVDEFGDLMAITVKERQAVSDRIAKLSDQLSLAHQSIDLTKALEHATAPSEKDLETNKSVP